MSEPGLDQTQRLPDFLIIGAPKSGTTWLVERLSGHPDICVPENYEINFFNIGSNYEQGARWYSEFFAHARPQQVAGEKSAEYIRTVTQQVPELPDVAGHIYQLLPAAKLIVVLRNPVQRALSAFHHHVRARRISPWKSFDEAARIFLKHGIDTRSIFSTGYYHAQLSAYRRYFGADQILPLIFEEDVEQAPRAAIARVCRFLGVAEQTDARRPLMHENRGLHSRAARLANYYAPKLYPAITLVDRALRADRKREIGPATTQALYDHYRDENEALFELIGRRADSWSIEDNA